MDINELLQEYMGSHRGPGPDDPGAQGEQGEAGESWTQAQRDEMIEIIMWKSVSREPLMKKDEKKRVHDTLFLPYLRKSFIVF